MSSIVIPLNSFASSIIARRFSSEFTSKFHKVLGIGLPNFSVYSLYQPLPF
jgi:hypothetical protein